MCTTINPCLRITVLNWSSVKKKYLIFRDFYDFCHKNACYKKNKIKMLKYTYCDQPFFTTFCVWFLTSFDQNSSKYVKPNKLTWKCQMSISIAQQLRIAYKKRNLKYWKYHVRLNVIFLLFFPFIWLTPRKITFALNKRFKIGAKYLAEKNKIKRIIVKPVYFSLYSSESKKKCMAL